ncbi:PGF-CTERM sorting domain-containing protein [Natrialbaceae archaeon AArc-T1-2]|uniref:PGF-CTERM sorting domain-containing protein n=1 Tax=Natrialbaceae archaeon AArc-T1-2 TaxID=3053904 RepID=UPI00255ADD46|nr:PGF-CTERM sorting domain-containing protein [Natrialbaceae archaeon AArc-T1-2]WIV67890.1 PGF-CTERM sorting domain-containing protein [Natrialbaceae archaeon AArc-T1-2]
MKRSIRFTTVLVAAMVAIAMTGMAIPAGANDGTAPTSDVHAMENGEDLYLSFGADFDDESLEEYIEKYADDNPSDDANAEVVQYQDVSQVNVHEQGQAVAISIDGGDATAIQDVAQQNDNVQEADATAENHETTFEDVGNVYVVVGNGSDKQFDGWGIVDDGDSTVTQAAEAAVSQTQDVSQANVNQNTTAFALAENESTANALQQTQQSNLNLQEGSANATNVYASDLEDGETDRYDEHKKGDDDRPNAQQSADADVEQIQEVDQVNSFDGSAVAIAVGEDSVATAAQIAEQSNLNEQIGTAEAMNVLMDAAGMNVATANTDGGTDVVDQDSTEYPKPTDKNDDDPHDGDVSQTAEASVTQYQSAEQLNVELNSSATAIATNGSEAEAIQLTFQQNVNAQVGSAEALNVFFEDATDDCEYEDGYDYDGAVLTETTSATIGGDGVEDADRTTFDYDGDNDQLNDVDQYSTAEIEQSQDVTQVNQNSNNALAVAEDDGNASAFQMTIQENENVQIASSEATAVEEGSIDDERDDKKDEAEKDDKKDEAEKDDKKDEATNDYDDEKADTEAADETKEEAMPGFGVAVALVAMLAAAMLGLHTKR